MLHPRDPSLDPQLVWKGKDEQDQRDLEVPVVPIYIQEKIHPQALIENLRAASRPKAKAGDPEQINLFADFNGIDDFEKKVAALGPISQQNGKERRTSGSGAPQLD
jgi:adenine-specific DNA-methyltransferase